MLSNSNPEETPDANYTKTVFGKPQKIVNDTRHEQKEIIKTGWKEVLLDQGCKLNVYVKVITKKKEKGICVKQYPNIIYSTKDGEVVSGWRSSEKHWIGTYKASLFAWDRASLFFDTYQVHRSSLRTSQTFLRYTTNGQIVSTQREKRFKRFLLLEVRFLLLVRLLLTKKSKLPFVKGHFLLWGQCLRFRIIQHGELFYNVFRSDGFPRREHFRSLVGFAGILVHVDNDVLRERRFVRCIYVCEIAEISEEVAVWVFLRTRVSWVWPAVTVVRIVWIEEFSAVLLVIVSTWNKKKVGNFFSLRLHIRNAPPLRTPKFPEPSILLDIGSSSIVIGTLYELSL